MLTSAVGQTLRSVETVIVDEIHSLAGDRRGTTWRCPWGGSTTSWPARPNEAWAACVAVGPTRAGHVYPQETRLESHQDSYED